MPRRITDIQNLSRPGKPLQDGDIRKRAYDTGSCVTDQYHDPALVPEPEQQFETVMDAQTFLLLLSPEELELLRLSETPLLVATEYLFRIRNGEVNTESDIFQEVMDAAVSTGILTQERADELKLGKPI